MCALGAGDLGHPSRPVEDVTSHRNGTIVATVYSTVGFMQDWRRAESLFLVKRFWCTSGDFDLQIDHLYSRNL